MADLVYSINIPISSSKDVVYRILSIHIGGVLKYRRSFPASTTNFGEFKFSHNDEVVVSVIDIDDANNSSTTLTRSFVAKDTVAPAAPTHIDINFEREDFGSPVPS